MINWLSSYNYDFDIVSLSIQILLLICYCARKNMPVRQNYSFLHAMMANFLVSILDIISCELLAVWQQIPVVFLYFFNMAYFFMFAVRVWYMFDYVVEITMAYRWVTKKDRFLVALPCILYLALVITNPIHKGIFAIDSVKGYQSGFLYKGLYHLSYFYIGVSLLTVLNRIKKLSKRIVLGTISFNLVLLVGLIFRNAFPKTLVMGVFSTFSIFIIFLTALNPDIYYDQETKVFNKKAFETIITENLFKKNSFHLIVIKLRNFDALKSVYGINQILAAVESVGDWLSLQFPMVNVYYFGNGIFILSWRNTADFEEKIEKIITRCTEQWVARETEVTFSPAIAVIKPENIPQKAVDIIELIEYVIDNNMDYQDGGYLVVDEMIVGKMKRKRKVEKTIAKVLKENRMQAYFQPIYSTKQNKIVGAEALARIIDPEMGYIPPSEFIQIAEQNGSIMEMGRQIFERVCEFISQYDLKAMGMEFVNVNLSPAQCLNEHLAEEFKKIAEKYNVSLNMIDFEITETSIEDLLKIQAQMDNLKKEGATFSLDDFGTGTSNITRLLSLPLSVIKLDMSVVWSYFKGASKILPDLVNMFKKSNLRIVVEGVETKEMCDTLAEMGCDYEQGYFFSKPIPGEDFIKLISKETKRKNEKSIKKY